MQETCGAIVYRKGWPDSCGKRAKVAGVLTMDSGRRVRLDLCQLHAKRVTEQNHAETRNRKYEPDYPYIATGTWEPLEITKEES